jgi:hypothetical protein
LERWRQVALNLSCSSQARAKTMIEITSPRLAGRTSGERKVSQVGSGGVCTIGCMYREQVDGPGGYDDTAMAVEQPTSRPAKVFSSKRVRPRAARDPEAPAGLPKGQGRRRKEGGNGSAMRSSTPMLAG